MDPESFLDSLEEFPWIIKSDEGFMGFVKDFCCEFAFLGYKSIKIDAILFMYEDIYEHRC